MKTTEQEIQQFVFTAEDNLINYVNNILSNVKEVPAEEYENIQTLVNAGFASFDRARELRQLENEIKETRLLKESFEKAKTQFPGFKLISSSQISFICKKYNLKQGPAHQYIAEIPNGIIERIKKFEKLKGRRASYSVIAPENKFDFSLAQTSEDPIIISFIDYHIYAIIGAWGAEQKILVDNEI